MELILQSGITRRDLLLLGLAMSAGQACRAPRRREETGMKSTPREAAEARLLARPHGPTGTAAPGLHELGLGKGRDGLLYIPKGYRADRPAPLAVMLHGAGGTASGALRPFQQLADGAGLILLAPDSRGRTWDIILGSYGPDIVFLDRALELAFSRCAVDPKRIAVEGFSDGASYALSLGITNGDLFSHVIAFSPGFLVPKEQRGMPRLYISHGKEDRILSIDACSRRLVPRLRGAGYDPLYREFDGPHTVPEEIAREALEWFTAG